jgi:hypothetical protein
MNNALAKARLKETEIPIGAHEVQKNSFEIERPMQSIKNRSSTTKPVPRFSRLRAPGCSIWNYTAFARASRATGTFLCFLEG